jgi:hypothetical protein
MKFKYTNYKGETEEREVTPIALEWMEKPGFDYQPGVFLRALDHSRNAERSFRLDERFQPIEPGPWSTTLYKFPTEEQITLAAIQSTVTALADRVLGMTIPTGTVYFYRHKSTPLDQPFGPVKELSDAVRINRDVFDIWVAHADV